MYAVLQIKFNYIFFYLQVSSDMSVNMFIYLNSIK